MFETAAVFRHLRRQLGQGWGPVTILHLMTDLGLSVKPDLRLMQTTRVIGLHSIVTNNPTEKPALEVVSRVRILVFAIEGTLTPYSLRFMDKVLMDIGRVGLLNGEDE